MPSTTLSPYRSIYQATTGLGYDGVVRIRVGEYYGTGVLLYDGRSILTAAHLFSNSSDVLADTQVIFETLTKDEIGVYAESVTLHPQYDSDTTEADLAIVRLDESAFIDAQRYSLYRENTVKNQIFTLVGYGREGTGSEGIETTPTPPVRRMAENTVDGDIDLLNQYLDASISWTPPASTQFIADFDNGNIFADASGSLFNVVHTGLGIKEGLISTGDSGGPAFIEGQVAGIASYTASLSLDWNTPDIDEQTNSSFGEVAAWQEVSYYQQWIDQEMRAHYENAPTRATDVIKSVSEKDIGTNYVYFLLEFTGLRIEVDEILSVDYATRDASATANEDYMPLNGTLRLYSQETRAVIAVEIIGDTFVEADEYFYLDVTNPIGGSFGEGIVMLTAMRTIVNDDGWI